MRANQLRLCCSSVAYVLVHALRRRGLRGTELGTAQAGTIRLRLFKVATQMRLSARRIVLSFPSAYPLQGLFAEGCWRACAPDRSPPEATARARRDAALRHRCVQNPAGYLRIAPRGVAGRFRRHPPA